MTKAEQNFARKMQKLVAVVDELREGLLTYKTVSADVLSLVEHGRILADALEAMEGATRRRAGPKRSPSSSRPAARSVGPCSCWPRRTGRAPASWDASSASPGSWRLGWRSRRRRPGNPIIGR